MNKLTQTDTEMSDPCKREACAIQDCLHRNGFDNSKCQNYIDKLFLCCRNFYEQKGDVDTTCCPKMSLLNLKLKQRNLPTIEESKKDSKEKSQEKSGGQSSKLEPKD